MRPGIHLSAIAYELGDPVAIGTLDDPEVAERLHALGSDGFRRCRVAGASAAALGAASARRTLERCGGPEPAAVVFSTESTRLVSATQNTWELLRAVPLPRTSTLTVGGNGCGNLAPALRAARDLVLAEDADSVLLTLADRFTLGTRYQPVGNTVMSDSAVSCLITPAPLGAGFQLLAMATAVNADLLPETRKLLGARTVMRAIGRALDEINSRVQQPERGFDWFVTGNYDRSTRRFLASAVQMDDSRAQAPNIAEYGHCYAADQLITLATLERSGALRHGQRLLLLATSARAWSLIALEYSELG
ncbi:hypothetical protein OG455_05840 [Kitasatospora sp. NBC_01287]|uniref:3-oxoacyl-[acyl-carrier-protein] synthase III C-terminal domain-containing protein n=1 Tax=Kitasatospora sp. NBC_01287 TaxID=2903573 RepID=UPI002255D2FD|nr:3-oxoacyl-[acyl-carrier-protein] synthase III C-terminal domain-containing protein [Kitasatospora sp. NBC_01287]MCX4745050.1 hypothetical protein [Kitasatospora sp. NBC_01287]